MKTIWKFPIGVHDSQTVMMPDGARILSVGVQRGTPFEHKKDSYEEGVNQANVVCDIDIPNDGGDW